MADFFDYKNVQKRDKEEPTFRKPHVLRPDPDRPDVLRIDEKDSDPGVMFGCLGRPDVVYMPKRNAYYKNANCTKQYTDEELQELGLPIPAEIENDRRKLRKSEAYENGEISNSDIIAMTMPKGLKLPEEIAKQLPSSGGLQRDIEKLKRSIQGRRR